MNESLRSKAEKRLPGVPHETLVTSLLNLAETSEEVERLVEELIATSDEALVSFKRKLSGLKRRRRFYRYSETQILTAELYALLRLLNHDDLPAKDIINALVSFFEADSKIMELGDDSHGQIGNVFSYEATQRFTQVASQIDDQKFLKKTFKRLYEENGYGVRDRIVDHAAEFLTEESLRELYSNYADNASRENRDGRQTSILAERLSAQLKDPELFEAEIRKSTDAYYQAKLPELAQVYLSAGRIEDLAEKLEPWFVLVPSHKKHELEEIAHEVYALTNDQGRLINSLTKQFLTEASSKAYQALSEILSPEELSSLLAKMRENALNGSSLDLSRVHFFLNFGEPDTAASLICKFSNDLNGDLYYMLPDLAKAFVKEDKALAATLVYRALFISILERARTKGYRHAARYLQILQDLSEDISEWDAHQDQSSFLKELYQKHYRKTSFWSKVSEDIKTKCL